MSQKTIDKKNIMSQLIDYCKSNLKKIIILISIFFTFFLSIQIFNFYSFNKIKENSITFFNSQILEDQNSFQDTILKLSKENDFYGTLAKLELIQINFMNKNYQYVIDLYKELLESKNIDKIYKSAVASRASYQFIDINFTDLSINYSPIIKYFISFIDDELVSYQGIKLELNYLIKILEAEKNNIKYTNFNEAIDLYNNIINSELTSSALKERINKIHEYFSYK